MRNAFADEVTTLAERDKDVFLLSGDIGNRLFDGFKERVPDRFLNCGVAEANMTGVAAGLAMTGLRPITYTITPFVTTRCLEQIRVDICYHELPVIIVGVGGGLSYASLGATHHSCEDIALLRAMPGMVVVCPADAHEVRACVRAALAQDQPVYIRLGKKGEPLIHDDVPAFELGRGITVREGNEACLLSTGNTLTLALEAAAVLEESGVSTRVVSLHTVKPLDADLLAEVFADCRVVATIEEHSLIGGLGGAVAEWLVDREAPTSTPLVRIGTGDWFLHAASSQTSARDAYGLTVDEIRSRVLTADSRSGSRI